MKQISDYFGAYVFNDEVMQQRLPKDVYRKLKATMDQGSALDLCIANVGRRIGGNALYPLVSADDRYHRRKA